MNETTVESLCSLITSGGTPNRAHPEYFSPHAVPWIKTGDLQDSAIVSYDEWISQTGLANSSAKVLPKHTVLVAMYGATVGRLGWLTESAACNQAACALIADPARCNWRWLFYALMWARDRLIGLASGAAQQNLNSGIIRAASLPAFGLPTQQAIAEVLGALDDKIAANDRISRVSDELVRARFAALDGPEVLLGEIAANVRAQLSPAAVDAATSYVGLEHLPRRLMWLGGIGRADEVSSAKSAFEEADILFGKLRPYFHKVVRAPAAGIASTDILVVRAKTPELAGIALAALSSDRAVAAASAAADGTRMPRANWQDLESLPIPWPSDSGVERFSRDVEEIGQLTARLAAGSLVLATTRDELLPLLMSGRLHVKDAERAVEEVL